MTIYVYTSIALNYFPKARVLSTSLKKIHPDWKFCIVIAENISNEIRRLLLSYSDIDEVLTHDQFQITDGFGRFLCKSETIQWQFKHSLTEFCTGIKGSALKEILSRKDCDFIFYLDPDIAIFDSLEQLICMFSIYNASILLTPHLIEPDITLDSYLDNERCAARHGIYNLGFLGIKNDDNGHKFADWWKSRLDLDCYEDLANGLWTDQSCCNAVPAFFDGVKILREAHFNVACWNLSHREITGSSITNLFVNKKEKMCFYHFSGFDSGAQLQMLNKYGKNMPMLYELRNWYIEECKRLDDPLLSRVNWPFNFYSNGEKIKHQHRVLYRKNFKLQSLFPDPFDSKKSFSKYCEHKYFFREKYQKTKTLIKKFNQLFINNG